MQLRFLTVVAALVSATTLATAQSVSEIPAPTVPMSLIDFDTMPLGPTTVPNINAAAAPALGGVSNLVMTPNAAAAGAYDTNATQNALASVGGVLTVIAPGVAAPFTATDLRIDLNRPCTEIGFGVGDWIGPVIIDFYFNNVFVIQYTSTNYEAASLFKRYQMLGGVFDRIDVRASTAAGNWVLIDLEVERTIGLHADFTTDVVEGAAPLAVNFIDASHSTAVGGILSYSWDVDGDNLPDYFVANPSHVYNACGNYNVSLTITDAANPSSTITKNSWITVDPITASFTISLFSPPNLFQLTDTSTPAANAWAWDTNGDNVPDSFIQNPIVVLPLCTTTNITLTATANCQSDTVTQSYFSSTNQLTTTFALNNGLSSGAIVYSDYTVSNPLGVTICAMDHNVQDAAGTAFTFDVFVTEGSYVGKELTAGAWRLVGSGSATAAGPNVPSLGLLNSPIHLPNGSFGVGVRLNGGFYGYTGTGAGSQLIVSDANLMIATGASQATPWVSTPFSFRQWNGTVYYSTCTDTFEAGYGYLGSGCAGSLPVGNQTINSPPVQGSNLSLTFNNLPFDLTIVLMGLSKTFSAPFGVPLPFDGTIIGATGCTLRVGHEPDLVFFILGGPGTQTASLSLTIPTDPVFLCLPIYTQAATPDPAGNPFGWVLSDAAGGVIGL